MCYVLYYLLGYISEQTAIKQGLVDWTSHQETIPFVWDVTLGWSVSLITLPVIRFCTGIPSPKTNAF